MPWSQSFMYCHDVRDHSTWLHFSQVATWLGNVCQSNLQNKINHILVAIWVPHDTIRISIQRSRYDPYLNTYLNIVRCQRGVVSSMKAEPPVIRSTLHNLLLQWIEYLLLHVPLVEPKRDIVDVYQSISINLIRKEYVFWFNLLKNTYAHSFKWIVIHWVCCIDMYCNDKISVHRDVLVNLYTPTY